ncbi:hypothetical protein FGO68_gene11488 [Halteria grandinella]|uniref:Uncharacterized protein n=1 Tax=Halteria grandinella TaxID=5974 RepID=A0A8J8TAD6_HALGN|nr:hypothetical protein FGO68_gene11488 [Halteria grandinella]
MHHHIQPMIKFSISNQGQQQNSQQSANRQFSSRSYQAMQAKVFCDCLKLSQAANLTFQRKRNLSQSCIGWSIK